MMPVLPPASPGQPTLADVIAAVRKNEQLYRDIEVVMTTAYDIGDRKPDTKDEVSRQKMRTRFVSQGEWFRLEREGGSTDTERTASLDRVRAFDGQTTRVFDQKAVGNIAKERLEDECFIRPHLLVMRYSHVAVPFSVYLSGHEAVRAHPNGRLGKGITMQITYGGEDVVGGLKCHKVLVKKVLPSGHVHDGEEFWLAADRNYLPVRLQTYTYRFSKDIPVGHSEVGKLREVKPGVWFPSEVETTAYNKFAVQRAGQRELQWRERHVVEKVVLGPKYECEFFSRVVFPPGTAMYELEKGKIIRSWRQGDR